MYQLRPYQQTAVDSALQHMRLGIPSCIVLPTGSGKSLVIAGIIDGLEGHTIVFQPNKEILEQNYEKFTNRYGDEGVAVYSASMGKKEIGKVTFATIGSVKNNMDFFSHFDNVIIDEAHNFSPKQGMYKSFLDFLGVKRIVGLTATPYRMYSTMQGTECRIITRTRPKVFDKFCHVTQIGELKELGFLADMEYFRVGDFNSRQIRLNSNGSEYSEDAVKQYFRDIRFDNSILDVVKRLVNVKRHGILVFVPSVDEARLLVDDLGEIAAVVSAETKKDERVRITSEFRSGRIKVVANVGVYTTGFDYPELDTVVVARPTRSIALWYQMVGRAIRPHPSKKTAWVVDMCDNIRRMGKVEDYELVDPYGKKCYLFNGKEKLTNVILSDLTN